MHTGPHAGRVLLAAKGPVDNPSTMNLQNCFVNEILEALRSITSAAIRRLTPPGAENHRDIHDLFFPGDFKGFAAPAQGPRQHR
jgi:hypothetical protein